MNKHETITVIIAEKRRRAEEIERDCDEKIKRGEMVSDCYARELVADIRREADRLEAALKREVATDCNKLGDCAKLREALSDATGLLESILEAFSKGTGGVYKSDVAEAIDNARAALAAPPRNCDRFADETSAQIAFLREVWLVEVSNLDRDPFDGWSNERKSRYSRWLFAHVTQKEGGAK